MSFKQACLLSCGAWIMAALMFLVMRCYGDAAFHALGAYILWQMNRRFDL